MTALHTLGILSTTFTWNAFPTDLKEFPHMLSTCWLLFLHSTVQLIPNHHVWVKVGWLWRPGHLMQHSITLLLGQIALTQPGGVLGHCPVKNQMIVPLSANQMGWRIAMHPHTIILLIWDVLAIIWTWSLTKQGYLLWFDLICKPPLPCHNTTGSNALSRKEIPQINF